MNSGTLSDRKTLADVDGESCFKWLKTEAKSSDFLSVNVGENLATTCWQPISFLLTQPHKIVGHISVR